MSDNAPVIIHIKSAISEMYRVWYTFTNKYTMLLVMFCSRSCVITLRLIQSTSYYISPSEKTLTASNEATTWQLGSPHVITEVTSFFSFLRGVKTVLGFCLKHATKVTFSGPEKISFISIQRQQWSFPGLWHFFRGVKTDFTSIKRQKVFLNVKTST